VSDAGRRTPKPFEPPPWERDQFDELARRKAEEAARLEAAAAAEREAVQAAAAALTASEEPAAVPEEGVVTAEQDAAAAGKPAVDQVKLDAMLLELSGQEPSAVREVHRAGAIAAWVLAAFGSVMLGLGIVLLVRGGQQALAGSGIIAAVGLFVIGFAIWLGYRASRGQGS